MALDLVIRGGTVATAERTFRPDLGIAGEKIAERGRGRFLAREPSEALKQLGREVPEISQLKAWNTPLEL